MGKYIHHSNFFYGNEVSEYGKEHGYVDYSTLAKAFDAVLCNSIADETKNQFILEMCDLVNGEDYDEETGGFAQVYQWFIISDVGARILQECTNEIVYYVELLDVYVWGVQHYGTSWDYVLTDIKIDLDYNWEES